MASSSAEPTTSAVRKQSPRPALVAAAVFVLVFLVALGSNRSLARVGGYGHVLAARTMAGDVSFVLLVPALVVFAAIASALWRGGLLRYRRGRAEPEWVQEQMPMAWWEKPLLLTMTLLPAAGLIAALIFLARHWSGASRPAQTVVPPSTLLGRPGHVPPGTGASPNAATPVVDWWIFVVAALVLLAAVALALVWRRLRPAEQGPGRMSDAWELQAVLEESLEELEREPDPRRAVIRAYTGMERTLAQRGLGRRPFEAPFEYLARALVALRVSRSAGERLTALFQRARFSEHTIDPGMKQEAIGALARVRDELAEQGR